jgi:hypothetical protein
MQSVLERVMRALEPKAAREGGQRGGERVAGVRLSLRLMAPSKNSKNEESATKQL